VPIAVYDWPFSGVLQGNQLRNHETCAILTPSCVARATGEAREMARNAGEDDRMARLRKRAEMQPSDDDDESGNSSEEGGSEGFEGEGGDDDWGDEDGGGATTDQLGGEQARVHYASSPCTMQMPSIRRQSAPIFGVSSRLRCACDTRYGHILVSP